MNLGGVAIMMLVLICAVMGIYAIAGQFGSTPYVDSSGGTTSNAVNTTQRTAGNVTAVVPTVGAGIVIILAVLFVAIGGGALYVLATAKGNSSYSRYNRY